MVSSSSAPFVQKKTLRKLGENVNDVVASGPSTFGVEALKKFGWKEGQGLGKNQQGRASYVRVVKKDDKRGIGCADVNKESFSENWWQQGFKNAASNIGLKSIGVDSSNGASSDSSSDSESDSDSDSKEETYGKVEKKALKVSLSRDMQTYSKEDVLLYKACKGRICGKRAGRIQVGKMLRERKADQAFEQTYSSITGSISAKSASTTAGFVETDQVAYMKAASVSASVILQRDSATSTTLVEEAEVTKVRARKRKQKLSAERQDSVMSKKAKSKKVKVKKSKPQLGSNAESKKSKLKAKTKKKKTKA